MIVCTPIPVTILDETTAISSSPIAITGKLIGVASTAGALDGSDTYTVKLEDAYGVKIYEVGTLAESSTTVDFATTNLPVPLVGPVTLTVTASAEQNDAAVDFTVYLYTEI
jgi:hypothetical protein